MAWGWQSKEGTEQGGDSVLAKGKFCKRLLAETNTKWIIHKRISVCVRKTERKWKAGGECRHRAGLWQSGLLLRPMTATECCQQVAHGTSDHNKSWLKNTVRGEKRDNWETLNTYSMLDTKEGWLIFQSRQWNCRLFLKIPSLVYKNS